MEVFRLFGRILVDDKEAQNSFQRTNKNTKTLGDRLRGGIKTAAKWGAALVGAATAAGAGMFAMANKASQTAQQIGISADKVGISTDAYQELAYWADYNNVSHGQFEKAIGRFNQRMGMAQNGNEKYGNALKELGVDMEGVRNGTISTDEAFAQSISTLSEMENEQDQVNLATEMFGVKLARDLLPALQDGSLSIDDARKKAQELGLVLSEDQIKAADEFQTSWSTIKQSLSTAATQIGLDLMPMFQSMMDWVIENLPEIRETFSNVFTFIGEAIGWVTDGISGIVSWLGEWASNNESTLSGIWEAFQTYLGQTVEFFSGIFQSAREIVTEVFTFISEFIREILTGLYEFWVENGQAFLENAILIFQSIRETIETVLMAAWEIIQQVLELVVPFIQEKLAQIQQFWSENGAQIMEAVQNAFSFIQSIIEFVMPAVQFVIETVWGIIQGIFNGALNIIMGLLNTFSGIFTGDWSKMWEGIKQLISGALEFVWNLINLTLVGRGLSLVRNFASTGVNLIRNFGTSIVNLFRNAVNGAVNLFTNLLSRGTSIFSNLSSSIRSIGTNILNFIKRPFTSGLDFIRGMGSRFMSAGRNIISSIVDGIKAAAGRVKDAIEGIVGGIRDFLPFSPAKEGPLKDLDKLDFSGPIEDSLEDSEHDVKAKMAHLLTLPDIKGNKKDGGNTTNDNRIINITVDPKNIDEFLQLLEIFTGFKQTVRKG